MYLVEMGGTAMLGAPQLRVVDDAFIARRQWRLVKTKGSKEILIDEQGYVEAIVVDVIPDAVALKITGDYL